ncbi:MAG TPA: PilZ domain-containing protein [Terracidiphilus sp.]
MDDEFQNVDLPSRERESPALGPPKLRRCESRYPLDNRATIHLLSVASRVTGQIVDISLGGCHIRTDSRFPLGIFRRVEAEFCVDGLPFRLGGVTQAIYDPFNVGIRFLDVSERKGEQLSQLVAEIKEQKSRAAQSDPEKQERQASEKTS